MLSLVETILNSLAKLAEREPILGHVTACPSGLEQDLFSANTRPRKRGFDIAGPLRIGVGRPMGGASTK